MPRERSVLLSGERLLGGTEKCRELSREMNEVVIGNSLCLSMGWSVFERVFGPIGLSNLNWPLGLAAGMFGAGRIKGV
jgi:hypothetical protein